MDHLFWRRRTRRTTRPPSARTALWLVVLLGLTVAGCNTNNPVDLKSTRPVHSVSQLLQTDSGGFVFKRGASGAFESCRYVIILKWVQPSAKTLYLRTRFENPADAARPMELDSEAAPGVEEFQVESPPVHGLRAGHNYKVEIVIFDSPERDHAIGVHPQMVQAMVKF